MTQIRNATLVMSDNYPGLSDMNGKLLQVPAYTDMSIFGPFLVFQIPDADNEKRLMFKLDYIDEIETNTGAI